VGIKKTRKIIFPCISSRVLLNVNNDWTLLSYETRAANRSDANGINVCWRTLNATSSERQGQLNGGRLTHCIPRQVPGMIHGRIREQIVQLSRDLHNIFHHRHLLTEHSSTYMICTQKFW